MPLLNSDLFRNADKKAHEDRLVDDDVKKSPVWVGMKVNQRLEDCAASDPKHIERPQEGPHVTVLHKAFEIVRHATLLPVAPSGTPASRTDADGDARRFNAGVMALRANHVEGTERNKAKYLSETQKTVLEYKKARDIRRGTAPVDNIVGIMTIQWLDHDLVIAEGGTPPPMPGKPPPAVFKKTIDIIVKFIGSAVQEELKDLEKNLIFPEVRMANYNSKPNRTLERIGHRTKTIGAESANLITEYVDKIKAMRKDKSPGIVIIYGSSSGGRNALDLALRLSAEVIQMEYVALEDAAFYDHDTKTPPDRGPPLDPTNTPTFDRPVVSTAKKMQNFFQIAGNHSKLNKGIFHGKKWAWASNMWNEEIHGDVTGFATRDLTSAVNTQGDKDDRYHNLLIGKAEPEVQNNIQFILDQL